MDPSYYQTATIQHIVTSYNCHVINAAHCRRVFSVAGPTVRNWPVMYWWNVQCSDNRWKHLHVCSAGISVHSALEVCAIYKFIFHITLHYMMLIYDGSGNAFRLDSDADDSPPLTSIINDGHQRPVSTGCFPCFSLSGFLPSARQVSSQRSGRPDESWQAINQRRCVSDGRRRSNDVASRWHTHVLPFRQTSERSAVIYHRSSVQLSVRSPVVFHG